MPDLVNGHVVGTQLGFPVASASNQTVQNVVARAFTSSGQLLAASGRPMSLQPWGSAYLSLGVNNKTGSTNLTRFCKFNHP